jgi:PadR family transcriptional regulator, regulatory protein AphA
LTIRYAILGLLSWQPLTGYDLKKIIADSSTLYWSGNNNQIYTTLIQLHKEGLVSVEVHPQESLPPRKIYSISADGRATLRAWVLSTPEPFEMRSTFLIQLSWAADLSPAELDLLLGAYEAEIEALLVTQREKVRRSQVPDRSPRERYLWEMVNRNLVGQYENELAWIRGVREGVKAY